MARVSITEVISFGSNLKDVKSVNWRAVASPDGVTEGDVLFESMNDEIHKESIVVTLTNIDGTLYKPEDGSIIMVQLNNGNSQSEWFKKPCTQIQSIGEDNL